MKIALAQMNSYLGDFKGNCEKIIKFAEQAKTANCQLVIFPELAVFGYHPCDLLERKSCVEEQEKAIEEMISKLPEGIAYIIGAVTHNSGRGKAYFNSALLIKDGKVEKQFNKQLLPVYDVFDDSRHFTPGKVKDNCFEFNGLKILTLVCEDMWGWDPIHQFNPITDLQSSEVDLVLNLSASPFTLDKRHRREEFALKTVEHLEAPLVYVNMVGGQDELIFDGGSFALDKRGKKLSQAEHFSEDLVTVDFLKEEGALKKRSKENSEHLYNSLVLGIRDFVTKTGFKKVHLGLSGGIDSALVASLAVDALGPENVASLALPTQFNSELSYDLAKALAKNLKCEFSNLPIQDSYESIVQSYYDCYGKKEFGLMNENIQARLRGLYLMAMANEKNSLLLTTGNKSEYATGYTTLYGDMCGGLAPIADLLKGQVYELCSFINRDKEIIPQGIIDREPSAELRPNQKDSDSLPDYSNLDKAVDNLVCHKRKPENKLENWVLERLMFSEFKRWQAPPILKVSQHAFGQGRRMPVAHKARY